MLQKDIGNYIVYSNGKVWSKSINTYLKPLLKGKYLSVKIIEKTIRIHRLVAECFIENPNSLPEINHLNGDKLDNRMENLEWCNHKQNMKHASKNKLCAIGSRHSKSKLTEDQIIEIRNLKGLKQTEIAKLYGVKQPAIQRILSKQNWKHI